MDPLRREKLENAIAYFAKRHYEKTGRPLTKIYLYKYLAFMDFLSVRETGRPAIGLRYLAMKYGPVPVGIIVHTLEPPCLIPLLPVLVHI
ncbi:type II toxin-antitoxin system antitoxin SocA domain-containing protein [Pampinifervens florentissimum]|uniref:type II toxin-antitoxin system antitoxin SocA domain-containing protein n=1 Tax=Pampinifervens florentissimum TaxID=1632019 RepID=UPI0013B49ED9|nr:type II toxin-antitoxin system antitoxin SocA domain-containing protein [Hydrogenobacter sp. T-8]QID33061.1 SocA family protein [Hydrogenobacter sp. T-8]